MMFEAVKAMSSSSSMTASRSLDESADEVAVTFKSGNATLFLVSVWL